MLIILQEQTSKVTEYNIGTEFGEFTPNDSVKERHPLRQQESVQCAYSPPYLANVEDRSITFAVVAALAMSQEIRGSTTTTLL